MTRPCEYCHRGRVTMPMNIGAPGDGYFAEVECDECSGTGEVEFDDPYALTETIGDPLLRKDAA